MMKRSFPPAFGLLEVLFSAAIFIVVVGSLVGLSRLTLRNATLSVHRIQALMLAQDGLETVRQMRDTTWIQPQTANRSAVDPIKDWLSYPDCNNGYPATGVTLTDLAANPPNPANYAICYDTTNFIPPQFGVKRVANNPVFVAGAADADIFQLLLGPDKANSLKLDPGAPPYYRQLVTFEPITNTAPLNACPTTPSGTSLLGLQVLGLDGSGKLCTLNQVESNQFVKVKVSVDWLDFDKSWSVVLDTLLTNWRPQ